MTKDEYDAMIRKMNIILPCAGALIVTSGILVLSGVAGPSKAIHHNALLIATILTAIGILIALIKMCSIIEEDDEGNMR